MKNSPRTTDRLASEHEALGREVTRLISDYVRRLEEARVCSTATPQELEKLFDEPLPIEGSAAEELLARFARDILPHAMNIPSPRYYGLFNPTPLAIAVWADALCSAINQNGAAWRNSPSASVVEARVIRWLCELVGYDAEAFGALTSGGSEANLVALKCARDRIAQTREQGVRSAGQMIVYASEQCHYSFDKSVDILGLGRRALRRIESDRRFHVCTERLRQASRDDLAQGRTPVALVGVAGATSTGAIDPLDRLADIAEEWGLWFHVDAAYGGALLFSDAQRQRLRGIERADSITIDPHKWMFVPFACAAVLVRGGKSVLRASFDTTPEYMNEARGGIDAEYDFHRYGQLGTRRFNALKLWMALKSLGKRGYAEIIEQQIELTRYLAARLDALRDFTRLGEVEAAVCCFRFTPECLDSRDGPALDRLQQELQQRIERSGQAWFASTVLHGRRALRVNINSFLTERRHVDELVATLESEGHRLIGEIAADAITDAR